MDNAIIKITRRGDDGYKIVSIRLKEKTLKSIDNIASQANRSRNEIINILLENSIDKIKIDDI